MRLYIFSRDLWSLQWVSLYTWTLNPNKYKVFIKYSVCFISEAKFFDNLIACQIFLGLMLWFRRPFANVTFEPTLAGNWSYKLISIYYLLKLILFYFFQLGLNVWTVPRYNLYNSCFISNNLRQSEADSIWESF